MLKLLTFRPGFDDPSLSPFCVKAMMLLDMSGQDWAPEWTAMPPRETYGKLPALRTPDGVIPDSHFIQDWLTAQGAAFFPGVEPRDRALAHGVMRMAEESLRLGLVHDRWLRDDCWPHLERTAFAGMPAPLRIVVPNMVRSGIRKMLKKQGMASYSESHRLRILRADLAALDALLGDGPWLFGAAPSAADAAVLPVLSMLDNLPCDTPLRRLVRDHGRLMAYVARGRAQLYPAGITGTVAAA